MRPLDPGILALLARQSYVIVSSLDEGGSIHNACKGIVRAEPQGLIYLSDVYLHRTFGNLRRDPRISITFVEEHAFHGYCLKGKARIIGRDEAAQDIVTEWEIRLNSRISQRMVRNLQGEGAGGARHHPEARFPALKYIIAMEVEEIVNLAPVSTTATSQHDKTP
jgi:general stress protein 26